MKHRIIYISIPMSGYDMDAQRIHALLWQRYFEEKGYEVVNPFNLKDMLEKSYQSIVGRMPTYDEYLHEDLMNLAWCTDIFLCNGWTESYGCMEETDEAIQLNLTYHFERILKTKNHVENNHHRRESERITRSMQESAGKVHITTQSRVIVL